MKWTIGHHHQSETDDDDDEISSWSELWADQIEPKNDLSSILNQEVPLSIIRLAR